jgi:cell division protein FtsB
MDPTAVTAILAAVVAVLGTQGFLRVVDVWGGRKAAQVEVDLKLSGGWQQLADRMSARVTTLEASITKLQDEVIRLSAVNSKLAADNFRLEGEVADLVARIKQLEGI